MRKLITRLAIVGATVAALMPVSPSAHAFVCNEDLLEGVLPGSGKAFCFVVYTATAPICKFGCG
jgi:hypothetical protein